MNSQTNEPSKELVIRDDDKIIEYKPTMNKIEKKIPILDKETKTIL